MFKAATCFVQLSRACQWGEGGYPRISYPYQKQIEQEEEEEEEEEEDNLGIPVGLDGSDRGEVLAGRLLHTLGEVVHRGLPRVRELVQVGKGERRVELGHARGEVL